MRSEIVLCTSGFKYHGYYHHTLIQGCYQNISSTIWWVDCLEPSSTWFIFMDLNCLQRDCSTDSSLWQQLFELNEVFTSSNIKMSATQPTLLHIVTQRSDFTVKTCSRHKLISRPISVKMLRFEKTYLDCLPGSVCWTRWSQYFIAAWCLTNTENADLLCLSIACKENWKQQQQKWHKIQCKSLQRMLKKASHT